MSTTTPSPTPVAPGPAALSERQRREIDYHKAHAEKRAHLAEQPVAFDVVDDRERRWWNAYWSVYDILLRHDLEGKRVLLPGCGFGEDAVRLARLGAEVYAFDISPEIVEVARHRLRHLKVEGVTLQVMAIEAVQHEDAFFDYAFFLDILHHVDIPRAATEIERVLKPGGWLIGDELYTHSFVQKNIRESRLVDRFLYRRMHDYIYDTEHSYITEDEKKIDEQDLQVIERLCARFEKSYYNSLTGRFFPDRHDGLSRFDRLATRAIGSMGRFTAGRVVFEGRLPA
ncbi:MAG: methyltransferase domain-containing protein [Geminicoccaceae bacterium]|nr:methyltransferase domain-containing protein [Geminicoccaceae bacterium]